MDWQQNPTLSNFAGQFRSDLKSQLKAIRVYQGLVPRLLADHGKIFRPMLRDLNPRVHSILVDSRNTSKITGCSDWQGQRDREYSSLSSTQLTSEDLRIQQTPQRRLPPSSSPVSKTPNVTTPHDILLSATLLQKRFWNKQMMCFTNSTEYSGFGEKHLQLYPKWVSTEHSWRFAWSIHQEGGETRTRSRSSSMLPNNSRPTMKDDLGEAGESQQSKFNCTENSQISASRGPR